MQNYVLQCGNGKISKRALRNRNRKIIGRKKKRLGRILKRLGCPTTCNGGNQLGTLNNVDTVPLNVITDERSNIIKYKLKFNMSKLKFKKD